MLNFALNLIDAGDVEAAALPHRVGCMFRDKPEFSHSLGGIGLDLEPDAKLRLGLPNASHLGTAIARDHSNVGAFPREGDRFSGFNDLTLPTPLDATFDLQTIFATTLLPWGRGAMTELVRDDAACRAVAEAKSVDEAKQIRDVAVAMKAYARLTKNRDLEADAIEIRMRATRRLDQLRQAKGDGWSRQRPSKRGLERNSR